MNEPTGRQPRSSSQSLTNDSVYWPCFPSRSPCIRWLVPGKMRSQWLVGTQFRSGNNLGAFYVPYYGRPNSVLRGPLDGRQTPGVSRCFSSPATIFTGVAPREALVDSRLILRWSRMPNWSSNASREMALPGRSLFVVTRAAYSISATGSPAIALKPRICRRKFSFGFTGRLAAIVRRTADLQRG